MTETARHLVLVHGAFHDGTCWDGVRPILEGQGFQTHAPTLPGHGDDRIHARGITMSSYLDALSSLVGSIEGRVVLIGHSLAGAMISMVGEQLPDRIDHMVYLSAVVPRKSDRIAGMDRALPKAESEFSQALKMRPSSLLGGRIGIDQELARSAFYHDLPSDEQAALVAGLVDQPIRPFLAKLSWTEARLGTIGCSYIECAEDRALPLVHQRAYQQHLNFDEVATLDGGHSPFLARPAELADSVVRLLGD